VPLLSHTLDFLAWKKMNFKGQAEWFTHAVLAIQEAKIRRVVV
jgi:hypothetical protein